jgi:hypothetical protein
MSLRKRAAKTPTEPVARLFKPRTIMLSDATVLKARRAALDVTEKGVETTLSGLCEIALLELLARKDLVEVLRRHEAKLRRG